MGRLRVVLLQSSLAVVALVVDLAATDAARLPEPEAGKTAVAGVTLPRLPVAKGLDPFPLVLASLRSGVVGD